MGCNYKHKGPKDRGKVSSPVKVARYVSSSEPFYFFAGPFTVPVSFNQQKWKYEQIEIVKNFADEVYSSLHFEGNSLKAQLLKLDILSYLCLLILVFRYITFVLHYLDSFPVGICFSLLEPSLKVSDHY